jgi:hypothetical protein
MCELARPGPAWARHGNGTGAAWERHGMCELALSLTFCWSQTSSAPSTIDEMNISETLSEVRRRNVGIKPCVLHCKQSNFLFPERLLFATHARRQNTYVTFTVATATPDAQLPATSRFSPLCRHKTAEVPTEPTILLGKASMEPSG